MMKNLILNIKNNFFKIFFLQYFLQTLYCNSSGGDSSKSSSSSGIIMYHDVVCIILILNLVLDIGDEIEISSCYKDHLLSDVQYSIL